MTWPGGPSGDDRTPDPNASGAGDESLLALSVPNDPSELADEIASYRRELRARRRRERFDRWTLARYWRPYGITGPVAVAAVVVIVSVSGLLLALLPNTHQDLSQSSSLGNATAAVGQIDGFLPDETVYVDGSPESVRALRPAVLVLVPPQCSCTTTVDRLASQAGEFGITTYVVTAVQPDPQMRALVHGIPGKHAEVYDPGGMLQRTYNRPGEGVSVIVVRSDAVVRYIQRNATETTQLHGILTLLNQDDA
ncbi:MAG: hypothetical protein ACJ735_11725 [Actinomycetes bacterium]